MPRTNYTTARLTRPARITSLGVILSRNAAPENYVRLKIWSQRATSLRVEAARRVTFSPAVTKPEKNTHTNRDEPNALAQLCPHSKDIGIFVHIMRRMCDAGA